MKKKSLWILFVIFSLLLLSCKEDSTNVEPEQQPDFTSETWYDDYDNLLWIGGNDGGSEVRAGVLTHGTTFQGILEINGSEVPCTNVEQFTGDTYFLVSDFLPIAQGQDITYKLTIGKASYTGTFPIPYESIEHFPAFNQSQPYNVTWSCPVNPQLFVTYVDFEDDDHDTVCRFIKQTPGSARSISVPESFWASYNVAQASGDVEAINYKSHGSSCLAVGVMWGTHSDNKHRNTLLPNIFRSKVKPKVIDLSKYI